MKNWMLVWLVAGCGPASGVIGEMPLGVDVMEDVDMAEEPRPVPADVPEEMVSDRDEAEEMDTGVEELRQIWVYFEYLPVLGADFVYEGWLALEGGPVSAGRFESGGDVTYLDFQLPADQVAAASAYVLTIEPRNDPDPRPSGVGIVGGAFDDDGYAWTHVSHPRALGTDFADASGGFILQTPSTADIAGDYFQGIWYVDPATGMSSLELPELPENWTYEAWILGGGYALSTGKFRDLDAADSDGGGPYAGADPTPPFPGQDYIHPALDLYGYRVAITVEPIPDDSPYPFGIAPLQDGRIDDLGAGVVEMLTNTSWYVPTGVVGR